MIPRLRIHSLRPLVRLTSTMAAAPAHDLITIRDLQLPSTAALDCWSRPKPQPLTLTVHLRTSIAAAGSTDHLPYSIHYGTATKRVSALVASKTFETQLDLAENIAKLGLEELGARWVRVVVEQPKAILRSGGSGLEITREESGGNTDGVYFVKDLRLGCIIGVNPWEREEKQEVVVNLRLYGVMVENWVREVVRRVERFVEASDYQTLEAFVTGVAKEITVRCGVPKVTVHAEKPSALTFAAGAGVEITRDREFFEETVAEGGIYVALGSNIGDRQQNITNAVNEMEKRGIKVKRTSSLYESEPMYVTDQPAFLNGVCEITTSLPPESLLNVLQGVENDLGREKTIRNGPRNIDLDIILYNNQTMTFDRLTIPHASMLARKFVLQPLAELSPTLRHPKTSLPISHHLSFLPPCPPLPSYHPILGRYPTTKMMSILNITPDSFSDGGQHTLSNVPKTASSHLSSGALILDIGGCSTRPGSSPPSEAEEEARMIPVIKALRSAGITAPISIDTYRSAIARSAIAAGASLINDISGGLLDESMFSAAAELGVPIIIGHTRGTPATMNDLVTYDGDLITIVAQELEARIAAAEEAGVRRWNIMLDPGLGFAKRGEQNVEILRRMRELRERVGGGFCWVVGASRKGFIGGGDAGGEGRKWGTAGTVVKCVEQGVEIVRVHDVQEMGSVLAMAERLW